MQQIDITGKRYGRLIVVEKSCSINGRAFWLCKCDCGNTKIINGTSLRNGITTSCGCYAIESKKAKLKKHGLSRTPLYTDWLNIKRRCYNKNAWNYKNYGGRGIKMCDEWFNSVESFVKWAIENGYKPGLSIDRINNNLGYSPENCRWTTIKTQANNKRSNHYITHNNITHTISEWTEILHFKRGLIRARLKRGWSEDDALSIQPDSFLRLSKRKQ